MDNPASTTTERSQRVLGLDYGSRRIGVSLSDPLGIIEQPRTTLKNDGTHWAELKSIIASENVKLVVVGMPLNLKGEKGLKAQEVQDFIHRLEDETGLAIVTWDERFTTSIAQQTLLDMGTRKKFRRLNKDLVDAMAASVILQSFLDSTKKSLSC